MSMTAQEHLDRADQLLNEAMSWRGEDAAEDLVTATAALAHAQAATAMAQEVPLIVRKRR